MSLVVWEWIVGVLANVASFVLMIPQVVRLLRTRRTEGVSQMWAAIGVVLNAGWLAYVLANAYLIPVPAIVMVMGSFALTLYLLRRDGVNITSGLLVGAGMTLLFLGVLAVEGWVVMGTALALANGIHHAPSVIVVWRTDVPVGVSPGTWLLAALEGVAWATFAAIIWDWPIFLFGVTAFLGSMVILIRLWLVRHKIRAELQGN